MWTDNLKLIGSYLQIPKSKELKIVNVCPVIFSTSDIVKLTSPDGMDMRKGGGACTLRYFMCMYQGEPTY